MISSNPFDHDINTTHRLIRGDARFMPYIEDESLHLVLTSPPRSVLKCSNQTNNQIDCILNYEEYLDELTTVCSEVYRILVPGGRLVCVISDMWLSRKKFGRHRVVPFHSDISAMCRKLGFDNLTPIIWQKMGDEDGSGKKGSKFLGAPYEPNGVIHSDIEFIVMQRKPGGYRKPTQKQRALSKINKTDYKKWFRQFWKISDGSGRKHSATFPHEIADRLVKMFSFWGDTVLDPFCGKGTTLVAAMKSQRNSIGIEMDGKRCRVAFNRLQEENEPLFTNTRFEFLRPSDLKGTTLTSDSCSVP